jgi:hypothetical protein
LTIAPPGRAAAVNKQMSRATKGAVAVAALATTVATKQARKVLAPHDPPGWGRDQGRRTHVVTVNLPAERVREREDLLAGLRELPGVTVDVRPAPADKGTELAVNGEDHDTIRKALRETKALLEVGEVPQPVAEGSAQPTPLNAPLRAADAHAQEGGRL